jgi:hypothetical protein
MQPVMPDPIRHPASTWIPAFTGMTAMGVRILNLDLNHNLNPDFYFLTVTGRYHGWKGQGKPRTPIKSKSMSKIKSMGKRKSV